MNNNALNINNIENNKIRTRVYGTELIEKEEVRLIEGSLFSTTVNGKTLKLAYEIKREAKKGEDYYGFELPKVGKEVEAIFVTSMSKMAYKNCLEMVTIDKDGEVYRGKEKINEGMKSTIFLDEFNMKIFKAFYKI